LFKDGHRAVDESHSCTGTGAGCLAHDGIATEIQKVAMVHADKGAVRQRRLDEILQGPQASAQHEPKGEFL